METSRDPQFHISFLAFIKFQSITITFNNDISSTLSLYIYIYIYILNTYEAKYLQCVKRENRIIETIPLVLQSVLHIILQLKYYA